MLPVRPLLPLFALTGHLLAQAPSPTLQPRPPIETPPVKAPAEPVVKTDGSHGSMQAPPRSATRTTRTPAASLAKTANSTTGSARALPDTVLYDTAADGTLWAHGSTWKGSFSATTCTFLPFLGSAAPHNFPLLLRLATVTAGGANLPLHDAAPVRTGDRIEAARGACTETFDLLPTSVEQSWVFTTLPQRGELRVSLEVTSELRGEDLGADLAFQGPHGGVRYEHAVAIDARGDRLELSLDLRGNRIELVVPAAFVEQAALPLVIDPVLSTTLLSQQTTYEGNADLAFDYTNQEFLVVWQRNFSATDNDVFAQRLDLAQAPVGVPFSLDFTGVSWSKPRVANNGQADNFLMVAECSNGGASPFWVGGRIYGNLTGPLAQFDIERAGVGGSLFGDCSNPDVGGDPLELAPSWFTIVWEREFNTGDHDIVMRQVTPAGLLRASSPTIVDSSFSFESRPSISKSNGYSFVNDKASQYWTIAYQRRFAVGDEDIRASHVTWDGQFVANVANYNVSASIADETWPVASSPTDELVGPRRHAIAFERFALATDKDIYLAVGDSSPAVLSLVDLNLLDTNPTRQSWPQLRPAIDCDGYRFAVAYVELYNGLGSDYDTVVSTFAIDPALGSVTVNDAQAILGNSVDAELNPAIASAWSGGGGSMQYGIAWDQSNLTSNFQVLATVYLGHTPGPLPTTRSTGCGSLGITLTDVPALGRTIVFQQDDTGPFTGFVFGFPTSIPIGVCPGCVLGVNGSTVMNPFGITMPVATGFLGVNFACQAWSFQSGTCLGSIALSDTIDFTVL